MIIMVSGNVRRGHDYAVQSKAIIIRRLTSNTHFVISNTITSKLYTLKISCTWRTTHSTTWGNSPLITGSDRCLPWWLSARTQDRDLFSIWYRDPGMCHNRANQVVTRSCSCMQCAQEIEHHWGSQWFSTTNCGWHWMWLAFEFFCCSISWLLWCLVTSVESHDHAVQSKHIIIRFNRSRLNQEMSLWNTIWILI